MRHRLTFILTLISAISVVAFILILISAISADIFSKRQTSGVGCIYNGVNYAVGKEWDDGCDFHCKCVDSVSGRYECSAMCPQYTKLPALCSLKSVAGQCCQRLQCIKRTTAAPFVPTPDQRTTVGLPSCIDQNPKDCDELGADVCSFFPDFAKQNCAAKCGMCPTATIPSALGTNVCVYIDGSYHNKGSHWYDACDYTCECVDPSTNFYNCSARCKVFSNLPSVCTLKPNPTDSCCERPDCGKYTPVIGNTITGTPPPNKLNIIPIGTHTVFSGSRQNLTQITGTRDACMYKGKVYTQGHSWDDGCEFTCNCENGQKGLYRCLSKCPSYPAMPAYCNKNMVPGKCCPVIECDVPGFGTIKPDPQLVPTPAPTKIGVVPTPAPTGLVPIIQIPKTPQNITGGQFPGGGYPIKPSEMTSARSQCVFKNKVYNQGEKWEIDCDFTCVCIDGTTGYYECTPKCPSYDNLPKECFTSSEQGKCCKSVKCVTPYGKFVQPNEQFPVVGSFHGGFSGFRPGVSYNPGPTSISGQRMSCIYKGVNYAVGKEWDDGCDFHCKCVDSVSGRYDCSARCPQYTKLPALCSLKSVAGQCCQRLECSKPTTAAPGLVTPSPFVPTPDPNPGCKDVLDNCAMYGPLACKSPYDGWARRNCQRYCNMCPQPGVTTATPLCQDKLPNCDQFGKTSCVNEYVTWAEQNCPSYCNLCPGQRTTVGLPSCIDQNPKDCDELGADVCSFFPDFAKQNCAAKCGMCPTTTIPSAQGTTAAPNGYILLMKGVTGITQYPPGVTSLFGLWNSSKTINEYQPGANSLTPNFPGHYKPSMSNNWPTLCLDKVKVSIYKNGREKAFIVFNATGADKMSWFTPHRIIDSSWIDLKSTTKQYFNMAKDPDFLREFYASQSADKSKFDSTGWIMVSTANRCFVESDKKPAFYYAPGQTSAHWGYTNPGVGDVFNIQGHSTCLNKVQIPTTVAPSAGCFYKGAVYHQGETWQDGCDYNCTCDNEKQGHFTCNTLCPVYEHLPPICHVEKKQGQCCGLIVCREACCDNYPLQPHDTCFYKGQYYGQDDTWIDDCKYKCTCDQAALGFYRCRELCVTWNLPPQCNLNEPKAGKCCKTPSCPPWIIIQYPPGYKAE